MEKINLNWRIPQELASHFSDLARQRWGYREQWVVASAAILLYLDADEETQKEYEQLANQLRGTEIPPDVIARLPNSRHTQGGDASDSTPPPEQRLIIEGPNEPRANRPPKKRSRRK